MRISDWSSDVCSSDLASCRSAASARRSGEPQAAVALSPGREGQGALLLLRELFERRPDRVEQLGLGRRNGEDAIGLERSEESQVGEECVRTCRYWWSQYS